MKNTNTEHKNADLILTLRNHLGNEMNLARVKLISYFIVALCKVKTINYDKIASAFDCNTQKLSNYRRIQRFMADFELPMQIVSTLIFNMLPFKRDLVLVMDRTNWKFGSKNINILMLGVCYKNVAFPLMFKMLDKRGNSNTQERIELIKQYIKWFGRDTIDCLLADREFVGEKWTEYLNGEQIRYYIRVRNNFEVYSFQSNKLIPAFWLFNNLKVNEFYNYPKILKLHGQLCYLSGSKTINRNGKIEFLIIVSYNKPEQAQFYYEKRWEIETQFRGLKSSGFNIEDTHVTDLERLEKLFLLTLIAFVWCYRLGEYIDDNVKKIKIKNHGRRAVSVFKNGLDYLSQVFLSGFNIHNINIMRFFVMY
jgi:hypothetical protein